MIRVSEIFGPTVQGEGALIGQPTVFVRTGGCDYRCSWCDTLHAVESKYREDWLPMSSEDIFGEVKKLSNDKPLVVTLSGGNPATQPLEKLIELGQQEGYRFAMETQGSVVHDWFSKLDVLTLSPKPPSSEMETDWDKLDQAVSMVGTQTQVALKIVIFDDKDYEYARHVSARYPDIPTYIQPGNHTPPDGDEEDGEIDIDGIIDRYDYLVNKIAEDQWFNVTLLPQLHVLVWGNKRGV